MPAYKDANRGTWYIKTRIPDPVTGENRQILKRGFPTKRDALAWEAKQKTGQATALTFRDLAQRYFDYRDQRPNTRVQQERTLEKHWPFLDTPYMKISRQMCMDWYLKLSNADLKPGTKNFILVIVKSVSRYASAFYDLPDPTKGLKRFKTKKNEMSVWTPEQFNRFISCVHEIHYRNIFIFMYWTGVRRSEAIGLQRSDITGDRCRIHRQLTEHGYSDLKTDSSERTIRLTPYIMALLRPILDDPDPTHVYLFGGADHLRHSTLKMKLDEYIKIAGVPKIRLHDFRHSYATNAIAAGANIVAVSRYLGHSDINTTLRVYAHLLEKTEDEMVSKMNEIAENGIKLVSQPELFA